LSFFGFVVIATSLLILALAANSLSIAITENAAFINESGYANIVNMETFVYTGRIAIQSLQNVTIFYHEIKGISAFDGINATLLGNTIVLKTYSKPFAISVLSK
jgi:hypothetical protein